MAGLTLILICVAARCESAVSQRPYQIQNSASIKEVWVFVLRFVMFLSAVLCFFMQNMVQLLSQPMSQTNQRQFTEQTSQKKQMLELHQFVEYKSVITTVILVVHNHGWSG